MTDHSSSPTLSPARYPKIYCAIDVADFDRARTLSSTLTPLGCGLKLGMEFYNQFGPDGVKRIKDACPDASIFLDLKFHDIPNTVAGAVRAVSTLGVDFINVHAIGGSEMMRAARDALLHNNTSKTHHPKILAVTVLTSSNQDTLNETGIGGTPETQVVRLAELTHAAGLAGVVCSAHEIKLLRSKLPENFVLMVPGIRPAGSDVGDQKRIMTPKDALDLGATHLVIGRPITGAENPASAFEDIIRSL